MIDFFFYAMFGIMFFLMFVGFFMKKTALVFPAVVLMILLGATLLGEGFDRAEGTNFVANADGTDVISFVLYQNYTQYNETWIWVLGNGLMYGGFAGVMALFWMYIVEYRTGKRLEAED